MPRDMIRTQRTSAARCRSENPCVIRSTRGSVGHELAFGEQHAVGQARRELLGKWGGRLLAGDDPDESLGKLALFTGRKGRLILDSVGDAAQQIRVADDIAQARGKLRNGERETCARHLAESRAATPDQRYVRLSSWVVSPKRSVKLDVFSYNILTLRTFHLVVSSRYGQTPVRII